MSTIYIVAKNPMHPNYPVQGLSTYLMERELVEETPHTVVTDRGQVFQRDQYEFFTEKFNALLYLEREAKEVLGQLGGRQSHVVQFLHSVEAEALKS